MPGPSPAPERPAHPHSLGAPRLALVFCLLGAALAVAMALASDGVHHDDDLVHLQIARWAWTYPQYLLHDWGRPGFTLLYCLPAQLGWTAARLFSVALTAWTAWLAFRVAQRQGIEMAALAPALLWLQPMTFTLSYTTLTEPVVALYLMLAIDLYLRRRFTLSNACVSATFITRHEAVLFALPWMIALWRRRRPWPEWLWLAWAPLAHNLLSAVFLGKWPALMFLDHTPTDAYGSGGSLAMLARWMLTAGPGLILLGLVGAPDLWRRRGGKLLIVSGALYLLAHSMIFRFGLFASGGYYRFLVPLGPLVAVCAAAGVARFAEHASSSPRATAAVLRRLLMLMAAGVAGLWLVAEIELPEWLWWIRNWVRQGAPALLALCGAAGWLARGTGVRRLVGVALVPVALLGLALYQPLLARGVPPPFQQCAPLVLVEDQYLVREATDWIRSNGLAGRRIIAANAWVEEFLGRTLPWQRLPPRDAAEHLQPGDLLVWDVRYAEGPLHGIRLAELQQRTDLVERWHGRAHSRDGIYCRVFEKK